MGYRMRPKKSLSQNFLVNDFAAKRIVDSLDLKEDEIVLEIGPGKGALTRHLVKKSKRVIGVEIDKNLCKFLEDKFKDKRNLIVVNKDVLKINLDDFASRDDKIKIVGNLPYKITSPVLSLLLDKKDLIKQCVLMVQKEVAERLCAELGTKNWSSLSVAVQLYSDVKMLFRLKPTSFFPPPKVFSKVIKMVFLKKPRVKIEDEKFFLKVVKASFAQRRKTILNSLSSNLGLEKSVVLLALNKAKIDPKRRAESLSLEEFGELGVRRNFVL
ncbi:MAG: hypothetical protein AMJ90_06235 [candidate division Zixibacteria bacterium SM23_73_2]|nr:MAG: hypothetical protein AMJ90_06235 [candidate division Zixibacteria bacterium SM23_73_2]